MGQGPKVGADWCPVVCRPTEDQCQEGDMLRAQMASWRDQEGTDRPHHSPPLVWALRLHGPVVPPDHQPRLMLPITLPGVEGVLDSGDWGSSPSSVTCWLCGFRYVRASVFSEPQFSHL